MGNLHPVHLEPIHAVLAGHGMFRFEMDGMQIAHMGDVGNPLNDDQIAFYEGVDVL
ncbi:MAG: MBL fold metallo-hydrolase, partial [Pseudomonadota bacterium]